MEHADQHEPHHDHGHRHGASTDTSALNDARLGWAIALNGLLTVAQIVGGVLSGSLSLVADALHNLNDAASLALALIARRIARKPADRKRTFGYRRAEIIGALINLTALLLVAAYLVYQAIDRALHPQPVEGWLVVIIAGVALVVDVGTAALTYAGSKHSMNIKAAFIHNVADALGSVAVIVAGTLILLFGWTWADIAATLAISVYIVYHSLGTLRQAIHILMEGAPPGVDLDELARAMQHVAGVRDVHHLHAWQLDEQHRAVEAHIVVQRDDIDDMERIKRVLKQMLDRDYDIDHTTLELEFPHAHQGVEREHL